MERDLLHIAIDGPAGSGKSSVARLLAQRLGLLHVDTGAMYRAITLLALEQSISLDDGAALARTLADRHLQFRDGKLHIGDRDVSTAIRSDEVTRQVSQVSAHGPVREAMVKLQRRICWAADQGAVLEGRDIGSVVLPLALCKLYLDASPDERAHRRAVQMGEENDPIRLATIEEDIRRRDELDSTREHSPLTISPDAHVLDTTEMSLSEVVDRCAELAKESLPGEVSEEELRPYVQYSTSFWWAHVFFRSLGWLFGMRIFGTDNDRVPGALIFASNHIAWLDPPQVASCFEREVHFLAKSELFTGPIGMVVNFFNGIPIRRGRWDPVAFARVQETLESGHSLLMFPEGTRKPVGRPGPAKRGLGILVLMTGLPFVPCYVQGTNSLWKSLLRLQPMELWIGPPRTIHALPALKERYDDAEIQNRIGELFLNCVRAMADRSEARRKGDSSPV